MPKISSLTPEKLIKILEKKGFILDRTKGSHRIYYHPILKRRVVVPFHKKDLPRGTLFEILKQAGINKKEIEELL
ncbi:MAG: type II toxin-antitoxin system HicA family toxin [Candidatus Thermoplasmatota archaeon]|nr:type II toxin-antitoxin system HicA family toxin [Candidatus Thermoplasmatota archaeon]